MSLTEKQKSDRGFCLVMLIFGGLFIGGFWYTLDQTSKTISGWNQSGGVVTHYPIYEIGYYGNGIVDIHGVKVDCNNIQGNIPQQCIDIQYQKSSIQSTDNVSEMKD